jgi:hypothetical protein
MVYRKLIARRLGVLELLSGVGAMLGGATLTVTPSGALLSMPLRILHGSPFHTFLIPGLLLCFVVGGSNAVAGGSHFASVGPRRFLPLSPAGF